MPAYDLPNGGIPSLSRNLQDFAQPIFFFRQVRKQKNQNSSKLPGTSSCELKTHSTRRARKKERREVEFPTKATKQKTDNHSLCRGNAGCLLTGLSSSHLTKVSDCRTLDICWAPKSMAGCCFQTLPAKCCCSNDSGFLLLSIFSSPAKRFFTWTPEFPKKEKRGRESAEKPAIGDTSALPEGSSPTPGTTLHTTKARRISRFWNMVND